MHRVSFSRKPVGIDGGVAPVAGTLKHAFALIHSYPRKCPKDI